MEKQTFLSCNHFDTARCPHKDHRYMKEALRVREGGTPIYQDGEKAFKANELCKDCNKFVPFSK